MNELVKCKGFLCDTCYMALDEAGVPAVECYVCQLEMKLTEMERRLAGYASLEEDYTILRSRVAELVKKLDKYGK